MREMRKDEAMLKWKSNDAIGKMSPVPGHLWLLTTGRDGHWPDYATAGTGARSTNSLTPSAGVK